MIFSPASINTQLVCSKVAHAHVPYLCCASRLAGGGADRAGEGSHPGAQQTQQRAQLQEAPGVRELNKIAQSRVLIA